MEKSQGPPGISWTGRRPADHAFVMLKKEPETQGCRDTHLSALLNTPRANPNIVEHLETIRILKQRKVHNKVEISESPPGHKMDVCKRIKMLIVTMGGKSAC